MVISILFTQNVDENQVEGEDTRTKQWVYMKGNLQDSQDGIYSCQAASPMLDKLPTYRI